MLSDGAAHKAANGHRYKATGKAEADAIQSGLGDAAQNAGSEGLQRMCCDRPCFFRRSAAPRATPKQAQVAKLFKRS